MLPVATNFGAGIGLAVGVALRVAVRVGEGFGVVAGLGVVVGVGVGVTAGLEVAVGTTLGTVESCALGPVVELPQPTTPMIATTPTSARRIDCGIGRRGRTIPVAIPKLLVIGARIPSRSGRLCHQVWHRAHR
jgi:hypothetical protein